MAQKTVVTVVCDLPHDGEIEGTESVSFDLTIVRKITDGEIEGTESVSFAFDGNAYDIDLCEPHSKELREKIGAFADHARRASASGRRRKARTGPGRERS